jgi:hypothetical protein
MGKPSENVDLYGKIHHLKKLGKSTSFLWPFSIATLVYQRGTLLKPSLLVDEMSKSHENIIPRSSQGVQILVIPRESAFLE